MNPALLMARRTPHNRHIPATWRRVLSLLAMMAAWTLTAVPAVANYDCRYTTTTVTIDGVLDDAVWQKAPVVTFLVPVSHEEPKSRTEGRVLWDDTHLYVGFHALDQDVTSTYTQRDDPTWRDDVFEVFLKPLPDEPLYYNFEINAFGTVYDAENLQTGAGAASTTGTEVVAPRRRRVQSNSSWNCDGLRHAVRIEGTINLPQDKDRGWTLEMAIPFASLPALAGRKPEAGESWRFHLARYDYSAYLPQGKELSSCAPLTAVNFHALEDFIELRFVK